MTAITPDHPILTAGAGKQGHARALAEYHADCALLRDGIARLTARAADWGVTEAAPALQTLVADAQDLPDDPIGEAYHRVWLAYRQLTKRVADLSLTDSWQSPAIIASGLPQRALHQQPVLPFLNDYQRYALPMTAEEAALDALYDPIPGLRQRTYLCHSGMGAFAALLHGLTPSRPAACLIGRHLYFESGRLLRQRYPEAVLVDEARKTREMWQTIATTQPDLIFLDPLANSTSLPALPFAELIQALIALPPVPRTLVMDTTLLGPAFQPATLTGGRSWPTHLQLITYRSLQKLDQEGMDLVTGGTVTIWSALGHGFDLWRQLTGALPTEQALRLLPFPDRPTLLAKLARHERNVALLGGYLQALETPWLSGVRLAESQVTAGHVGPLFWVEWPDALSGEDAHRFLLHLVHTADAHGVPLAYGTSFGFPVTRVAAFTRTEGRGTSLRVAPGTENLLQLARLAEVWQEALATFGPKLVLAYQQDPASEWHRRFRDLQAAVMAEAQSLANWHQIGLALDAFEPLVDRLTVFEAFKPLVEDLQTGVIQPLAARLAAFDQTDMPDEDVSFGGLAALSAVAERLAALEDRLTPKVKRWWQR